MDADKNTLISRSETETENFASELASFPESYRSCQQAQH